MMDVGVELLDRYATRCSQSHQQSIETSIYNQPASTYWGANLRSGTNRRSFAQRVIL